jgi:putative peptidoglycan lipid II flippase
MRIGSVSDIESKVSYRAVSEATPAAAPARRKFGGYAALVAAGILLSRIAGLIRQSVFAHYFGATGPADAFNVALKVPNFLQNMLGEGVLSAAFIPVYSRLVSQGKDREADRVAGVLVSFLAVIVAAIVTIGVIFTPLILSITTPGLSPPVMEMAIRFTRIIFPGVGLLVLYAWALGILNTHRQFFIGYVAPVLWSATMIATMVIFGMRMRGAELAHAVAWGALIGFALQFLIEIPFVFRHARHLSFGFDFALEPVRTIFRNIIPVVGGRGVVQISAYVDTFIASFVGTGAIANLAYAQAIYILPISVFGMSIANAELPQMSGEVGTEEEVKTALRRRLDRALRQVAFFVVPTMIAFLVIGRLLVAALYQRGVFGVDATLTVWYALAAASLGLIGATFGRLYSSTFYALHDTKTPFRVAIVRVIIGAGLALLLALQFREVFPRLITTMGLPLPTGPVATLGIVGITLASAVAAWVECLLLRRAIQRRIGRGESKAGYLIRLFAASIAGGVAAAVADIYFVRSAVAGLPLPRVIEAAIVCLVFGCVYFAVAFTLRVEEVRATIQRFMRSR